MKPTLAVFAAFLSFAALSLAGPTLAIPAPQAALGLAVTGEDGHRVTVTAADLAALPQTTASITHEGKTTLFRGPLLADVLKRVDAPLADKMRGAALSDVVIVTAADGYVVSLALSDLEPGVRPTRVVLADQTADGAPLGDKDGPFRLVVDGDLKPARSERNVVSIEVRRLRSSH